MTRWARLGYSAVLALLIGLAWSNTFNAPFELDDQSSIRENTTIRDLGSFAWIRPPAGQGETVSGRPVLNASFALNYALGGLDVRVYHLTNLAIHLLSALTLFGLVRRCARLWALSQSDHRATDRLAFVVAAIWGLHPLQTQAVTYVVQRAESLMALFYLLTLYCFVRAVSRSLENPAVEVESAHGRSPRSVRPEHAGELTDERPSRRWLALSVGACFLGMATKENMVSAPLAVLLLDRAIGGTGFLAAWKRRRGYYALLFSSWALLLLLVATTGGNRGGSAGFDVGVSASDYWLTQFPALFRYVALSFWPNGLVFEYGPVSVRHLATVIGPMALVAAGLAGTLYAVIRRPLLGVVAFVAVAVLAPTSIVPGTLQMIVEHRMYLPLACLVVLVVFALQRVVSGRNRMLGSAAAVGAIVALASITFARNRAYASELLLWQDTASKRPANPRAHNNLGVALREAGRSDAAMAEFRRAIALQPNHAFAHANLGIALMQRGQWSAAVSEFQESLAADPDAIDPRINLAVSLGHLDRRDEAIAEYRRVLQLRPRTADAEANLAALLLDQGNLSDAELLARHAVADAPGLAEAHLQYGRVLERQGKVDQARREYRVALECQPGFAAAHLALGNLDLQEGDVPAAEASYREAMRLNATWAEPRFALGNVFARRQQWGSAIASYQEALALAPEHVDALNNLANCELMMGRTSDAIRHYEAVLRQRPTDASVVRNLALARELLTHPSGQP